MITQRQNSNWHCIISGFATANERLPVPLSVCLTGNWWRCQIHSSSESCFLNFKFKWFCILLVAVQKDLETFDLEDFKYNFVNISAFRMVDADAVATRHLLRDMEKFQPIGQKILNKSNIIQAEPALMYDSVMALAHGLAALDRGTALRLANLSCDIEQPWNDGSSLFNYINTVSFVQLLFCLFIDSFIDWIELNWIELNKWKKVEFTGLTGAVRFKEGRRYNVTLDLLKLKRENLTKVGEWNSQVGLNITDPVAFYEGSTPNITLIVMTNEVCRRPLLLLLLSLI